MLKLTIYAWLLVSVVQIANAQSITDEDKRGFDDLKLILIELDGDGKPDTIQPRTYSTNEGQVETHWITFDLQTTKGEKIESFFTYQYGTSEADYWVYALIAAGDIDQNGKTDLTFYVGDDTSDETITLLNKGGIFEVHSRKISEAE